MLDVGIGVRSLDGDLLFERAGFAVRLRQTVSDRATLTISYNNEQISEVSGVRMNTDLVALVISAVLGDDDGDTTLEV